MAGGAHLLELAGLGRQVGEIILCGAKQVCAVGKCLFSKVSHSIPGI